MTQKEEQPSQLTEQQEKSYIEIVTLCVDTFKDATILPNRQMLLIEVLVIAMETLIGNRLGFPADVNVGALRGDIKQAVLRWCFTSKDCSMRELTAEMDKIETVKINQAEN